LHSESVTLGTMAQIASEPIVEILGHCGFDYVAFDMEHTSISLPQVESLVRAAQCVEMGTIVRLGEDDASLVARLLDAGVDGVMLPRVSSAQHAESIVRMTQLAPRGLRGACPETRAGFYGVADMAEYTKRSLDTVVVAMIETRAGVENMDEILSVPGIDAAMLGFIDLAYDLDVPPTDPQVVEAGEMLLQLATKHGVEVLQIILDADQIGPRLQAHPSQRNFWFTTDSLMMGKAFKAQTDRARSIVGV